VHNNAALGFFVWLVARHGSGGTAGDIKGTNKVNFDYLAVVVEVMGVALAVDGFGGYTNTGAVDADINAAQVGNNFVEGGLCIWAIGYI
jgi:hypothetical protein